MMQRSTGDMRNGNANKRKTILIINGGDKLGRARNWHGRNMDIIIEETANDRKMKYIYALAVAIKYILGWIERQEK